MPRASAAPAGPSRRHVVVEPGVPFCAHAQRLRHALLPAAFDWAEILIVRDGTGRVRHRDEPVVDLVKPGSVVVLMPDVPCGVEPEGLMRITSVFLSEEFLRSLVRLQTFPPVRDDATADVVLQWAYPRPSQVVLLEKAIRDAVFVAAAHLAELTDTRQLMADYYRASRLVYSVLESVVPLLARTRDGDPLAHGELTERASLASTRVLRPLDDTVRQARQVIREHYREPMLLDDLATAVHVSSRHLSRLFTDAMGKTPLVYRDALRVQHMIRLLVATTTPVGVITAAMGWEGEDQAVRVFRDAVGMTPRDYRVRFAAQGAGWAEPAYLDRKPADLDMFEQ